MPTSKGFDGLGAASRLRRMLAETDDLIVCPGVYDGLSARLALNVGFDALYMVRGLPNRRPIMTGADGDRRPEQERLHRAWGNPTLSLIHI